VLAAIVALGDVLAARPVESKPSIATSGAAVVVHAA
jgi:hypothetical protein